MLDQSIIDNMNIGSFDETILEADSMAFVDTLIEQDEEAEYSLMAESTFFDNIDHILDL